MDNQQKSTAAQKVSETHKTIRTGCIVTGIVIGVLIVATAYVIGKWIDKEISVTQLLLVILSPAGVVCTAMRLWYWRAKKRRNRLNAGIVNREGGGSEGGK